MKLIRLRAAMLIFGIFVLLVPRAVSQTQCFRTCSPNPTSPTYSANVNSQFQSRNARGMGSPVVPAQDSGASTTILGSSSYSNAIPILHLPGRAGLDLDLTLYYNSNIWTYDPSNNSVTFNADRDWPSYGFRLDFGLIIDTAGTIDVIGADGSKHTLPSDSTGNDSIDSSYMNFNLSAGGASWPLTYKNGTQVWYENFPSNQPQQAINLLRPIKINDTNGNFITITYVTGTDQQINTITDTLGRVIQFNYDGNGHLVSITSNNGVRTWATFTWNTSYTLNYSFSASVQDSPANGTTLSVLTGITLPNNTQYTFAYGAWGIVNQITTLSSSGKTRGYQAYDYPGTGTALSMPPTYGHQTVSDGTSTRQWTYAVTMVNNMVSQSTITAPGGTATTMNLYTAAGDWKDGLVSSVQVKDSSGNLLRQVDSTWTADATTNANPRLSSILTTLNDTGQQSRTDFLNYDSYGNVTDQKDYDFGLVLKREIVSSYSTAYTSNHILNLPTQVYVNDAAGNHLARTDYAYDTGSLTSTITGTANHNDSYSGPRASLTSLTRYTDPVGGTGGITRTFAYDSLGNLVTAQLDCCNQKQWNYSSATQYAYPDSVVRGPVGTQLATSATYNLDTGTIATATDENNQVTRFQYDSSNRISTVTQPDSLVLTYSYDDSSASPSISISNSANSAVQKAVLDGLGRTLQQQLLNGTTLVSSSDTQYDDINRKIKNSNPYTTGETQLWTTSQMDALGRVTQVTPPSGGSYQYQYSGNAILVTDPAGLTRRSFTDYLGKLVEVDEPGPGPNSPGTSGSGTITISGSLYSTTTSGTKATGWFTVSGSDQYVLNCGDGGLCNPRFASKTWDSGSLTLTVNGIQTAVGYGQGSTDPGLASGLAGQLSPHPVTYSDPGTGTIYITADVPGPNYSLSGNSFSNDPADFGFGSFSISLSGSSLTGGVYPVTTYDSGTLTVTVNGFPASASYNQNLNNTASAMAQALTTALNASGSPVTASVSGTTITLTAKGVGTSTNYSVTGSSTTSFTASNTTLSGGTNPSGIYASNQTFYAYRATGELVTVTEGVQGRTYSYDGVGRLTSSVLPEDGTTQFTYTDFSAVNTRTDARGVVTTYSYDGLHRLISVAYNVGSTGVPATPTVSYTYGTSPSSNNNGRVITMTDGAGSETYSYDLLGRITQLSRLINGITYNIGYGYNAAGELNSLTYPSGRVVSPGYDAIGRMTQVVSGGSNHLSGIAYNSAQLPTGFNYGNGVQASFSYNDHLQLASLAYTSGSNTLLNLTYNYGSSNNGQIQGITDSRGAVFSTSYSYDSLGRLTQAQTNDLTSANTWKLGWNYDRYGNRLSQTLVGGTASIGQAQLTVDPNTNHITSMGFSYDAAGNLKADSSHNYVYNAEGELVQVDSAASYAYDGHRWRIQKTVSGNSTVYVYSGSKVIAEYASGAQSSSPSREYIYSGSTLLATTVGTAVTYHQRDHLSNRVETDSSDNVVRAFGHLPFGETWYETSIPDKWKFTSYERDSTESGLDYAMHRFYGNGFGRFQSPDLLPGRLANPQSQNRYSYVVNDPVSWQDPLGLAPDTGGGGQDSGKAPCSENTPFCISITHAEPAPDFSVSFDIGTPLIFRPGFTGGGRGCQELAKEPPSNGLQAWTQAYADYVESWFNLSEYPNYLAGILSSAEMTAQFADGTGPYIRNFGSDSPESQNMLNSPLVRQAIYNYLNSGVRQGYGNFEEYGTGPLAAGINPTAQFVGGFEYSIAGGGDEGALYMTITNKTSLNSLLYHQSPSISTRGIGKAVPFSTVIQKFHLVIPCFESI